MNNSNTEKKLLDAAVAAFKSRYNETKNCDLEIRPVKKTGSDLILENYLQALKSA